MSRNDKRDLVVEMLASLPDRYGFCIDAVGTRLHRWARDTQGTCNEQVAEAAEALNRASHQQQPRQHDTPERGTETDPDLTDTLFYGDPTAWRSADHPYRGHGLEL